MDKGLLIYDESLDSESIPETALKGLSIYKDKYDLIPNKIHINSMYIKGSMRLNTHYGTIIVTGDPEILPKHLWIGVENG